jgi:hypothetical protein
MKKYGLFFLGIFFSTIFIHAQFVYKWDSKSFSFTSPFELTKVESGSIDDFNWQNDEYTIEISAFGIGYYNTYYGGRDIKTVAFDVAGDQSFYDVVAGDSLPLIESGYYVLAKTPGDDNQYACVIVIIGFSEKKKIYFEARIYCYNNKYKKGIEIAKSFSLGK